MFIGHFAVAFGVKRVAPEVNLGTAILAASFLDIVWPVLVAAGVESVRIDPGNTAVTPLDFVSYPYSHSLVAAVMWAVVFAWVYRGRGGSARGALWLAAAVFSHWLLDAIVHRPDLPLMPGLDARIGLGLWNSVPATLVVEGMLFAGGLWLYLSATRARDRIGSGALAGLVALLLLGYAAAVFGPPPPGVSAIVIADIVGTALCVMLALWVERHRDVRVSSLS